MKNLYTIYDRKADVHITLFPHHNEHTATREFARSAMDPQSNIHLHPEDYVLIEHGTFDEQNSSKPLSVSESRTITTAASVLAAMTQE